VFYAGYYCDFALLAKQLRAANYNGQLMSDDGSLDPHYVSEAGPAVANGTVISCACADLPKAPTTLTFINGFKKLAGFAVGTYSAEAYDATNTIIDVMKGLGTKITRGAIVKGLHKVDYVGITKTVKFKSNGDISGTAVYVYKVRKGTIIQLGLVSKLAS
jgi:branched-chain amino acid transport system substrate-binding protein